jgi:hypothetical protein
MFQNNVGIFLYFLTNLYFWGNSETVGRGRGRARKRRRRRRRRRKRKRRFVAARPIRPHVVSNKNDHI